MVRTGYTSSHPWNGNQELSIIYRVIKQDQKSSRCDISYVFPDFPVFSDIQMFPDFLHFKVFLNFPVFPDFEMFLDFTRFY